MELLENKVAIVTGATKAKGLGKAIALKLAERRTAQGRGMSDALEKGHLADAPEQATQFICDLCTGSGCIAVAIGANFAKANVIATDICDSALEVAAANVEKHNLSERITLLHGDLFEPVISQLDTSKFDLIVCNPPYISAREFDGLDKNVKDYEPKIALFAGSDGLDVYRRIIEQADLFLKPDGAMMLEIGYAQGPAVKELIERTNAFAEIAIEKDRHNNDRIITATKVGSSG